MPFYKPWQICLSMMLASCVYAWQTVSMQWGAPLAHCTIFYSRLQQVNSCLAAQVPYIYVKRSKDKPDSEIIVIGIRCRRDPQSQISPRLKPLVKSGSTGNRLVISWQWLWNHPKKGKYTLCKLANSWGMHYTAYYISVWCYQHSACRCYMTRQRDVFSRTFPEVYLIEDQLKVHDNVGVLPNTGAATPKEISQAFTLGAQKIIQYGGAQEGNRTMLDALLPAANAFQLAIQSGYLSHGLSDTNKPISSAVP